MIGLCLEAETKCSSCGQPLPMNALVETIVCSQCSGVNKFSVDDWKLLLEDMFTEAPNYEENEGTPSTVMGSRNYNITYGRQNPKFSDTKTYMDMEDAIEEEEDNKFVNPETGVAYSIRPLPEIFKDACPHVTHLVCEDFSQLPNINATSKVTNHAPGQLVPFTCPSCAGTLQLSNDSERKLKCQFCSTESFIPDEIWQKLHPTKTKSRFYFWLDENAMTFQWEKDLYDIVADAEGIIYLSMAAPFLSDDDTWIVALNPDFTLKWKRGSLKFKTNGGAANMGLSPNGELMLWSTYRNTMLLLSCADGSEIKRIGKKTEGDYDPTSTLLDTAHCRDLTTDYDGNFIGWVNRPKPAGFEGFCEFLIIDQTGTIHKPWGLEEKPKGFFGSLKKAFSNMGDIPYFDKLKDKFTKCKEYDVKLSVGLDGSYYIIAHSNIVKYSRSGEQIYMLKIEEGYIRHKMVGDKLGNAYYIISMDDKYTLKKVSPDGSTTTTLVENVLDGGSLCDESMLTLSASEILYCADYGGALRTFNMKGELLYASPRSLEEEKDAIKEKTEMED